MLSRLRRIQGFSLIELSIVLLIAGLLVAGAFQLTSNMQRQRSDQALANEMKTVVSALERFLVDQQGALTTGITPILPQNSGRRLDNSYQINGINALTFFRDNYLPGGAQFNLTDYTIGLRRLGDVATSPSGTGTKMVIRGLVLRNPSSMSTMNDTRLSRVAALIGSQGGVLPQTPTPANTVQGVFGAWNVLYTDYGVTGALTSTIAGYTTTADAQINTNLLSRIDTGNPEANTMRTDLRMGAATGTPQSTQPKIRNVSGVSYLATDATAGSRCDTGSQGIFDSIAQNRIGTFALDASVQNLLVYGSGNATSVTASGGNTPANGSMPTLLKCQRICSGIGACQWEWRVAMAVPQPTAWSRLTGIGGGVYEGINNNPYPISISYRAFSSCDSAFVYVSEDQCTTSADFSTNGCSYFNLGATRDNRGSGHNDQAYMQVPSQHAWYIREGTGGCGEAYVFQ